MGKTMRLKKKGKNKSITLSKAEINEFNRRIVQGEEELKFQMVMKTAILFTAYVMEEEVIGYDKDKILSMYQKIVDWVKHLEDHTISIKKVEDIINDATDLDIHWND